MTREILTADQFFKIAERPKEDCPFPEAGNGHVLPVWGLTPTERTRFEKSFESESKSSSKTKDELLEEYRERLVRECVRNDDGSYVFTIEQVAQLGQSSCAMVERCFDIAARLSGITNQDAEDSVKN